MQLHEAVKKARKELGLTQAKLAELAGIERKQLSVLENGGNVTLSTVRKVIAHLPNMQSFTIGEAMGSVVPILSPEAKTEMDLAAEKAVGTLLRNLLGTLGPGRWPTAEDVKVIDDGTRAFYRSVGFTDEEYDKETAEALAKMNEALAQLNAAFGTDKKG